MYESRLSSLLVGLTLALTPMAVTAQVAFSGVERDYDMQVAGASATQISGDAAFAEVLTGPPNSVLVGLRFSEFQDKPCVVRAYFGKWAFGQRNNSSSPFGGEVLEYAESQAKSGNCDERSVQETRLSGGFAVHRIQICQRRQNDRLKGASIDAFSPTPQGPMSQDGARFERTNCNEWQSWVACPQGQVARGLVVHRAADVIQGLGLQCGSVTWNARSLPRNTGSPRGGGATVSKVSYVGGTQQSGVSGTQAREQVLNAPAPGMTLQGFTFGERNDRPCFLQARFWKDDFSTPIQTVNFNRCDGSHGSERTVAINGGGAQRQVVSSVAVCQRRSSQRLKGIRLLGSRLEASGAVPDPAINDQEARTNCNQWHQPAHCPQTFVAVGVRVHYRDVSPAEIQGISLDCRAVRYN